MASYLELQVELEEQTRAWKQYESDLQVQAVAFCEGLASFLRVPDEVLLDRNGNIVPYIELGSGMGERFRQRSRFELELDGSQLEFVAGVNLGNPDGGVEGFTYQLRLSRKDGIYAVLIQALDLEYPCMGKGTRGEPDFTPVYERIAADMLDQLQRRP